MVKLIFKICRIEAYSKHTRFLLIRRSVWRTVIAALTGVGILTGMSNAQSLREEIKNLAETHPNILEAHKLLKSAIEDKNNSSLSFYPSLSLTGSSGLKGINDPTTRASGDDTLSRVSNQFEAKISYNLFQGFYDVSTRDKAKINIDTETENLANITMTTVANGARTYLELARDLALIDVVKEWKQQILRLSEDEVKRLEGGETSRIDDIRARSRLNDVRSNEISLLQQLTISEANYEEAFGHLPDHETMKNPSLVEINYSLSVDDALDFMDEYHPALRYQRSLAAQLSLDIERNLSSYYPSADFVTSYDYSINTSSADGETHTGFVGLEFGWTTKGRGILPIYETARDTSLYQAGLERIKSTRRAQARQVRAAYSLLRAGQKAIFVNEDLHELAQQNLTAQRQLFEEGVVVSMDQIAQAINTLYLARTNVVRQRYANQIAQFDLLFAAGILSVDDFDIGDNTSDQTSKPNLTWLN